MRATLLLALFLPWLAWAQPGATSTPVSEAHEKKQALERALGAEEEDEAAPSAKDNSRPAVFGVMIAQAQSERAGTPIQVIQRRSVMPWIFSLMLLPVYLHIARRRGFRIR
ncbi:MAG: hypothetical protein J0I12_32495 [Candidatus Eremiobacteraeota bacterium]|nr:hypothetical protein [Candidatus Eremiobacteraeota bacterium]